MLHRSAIVLALAGLTAGFSPTKAVDVECCQVIQAGATAVAPDLDQCSVEDWVVAEQAMSTVFEHSNTSEVESQQQCSRTRR